MRSLLVLALVVAGCGGTTLSPSPPIVSSVAPSSSAAQDVGSTLPSATPSALPSAPAPTPTASPDPESVRKAAGSAYLAAVNPYNKTIDALGKKYQNKTSLKALKAYCLGLANAAHTWVVKLKGTVVPADTAADMKSLIRNIAATEADLRTCSKARSLTSWNLAWAPARKASVKAHEDANLVRLDLGLPSVGG